jgi:AcrR family transcriptional regulator
MASNSALSAVPDASAADPVGWQAQKSAATRNLIIEAAIRCFVELGYAQTTTTAIAEKAGLSRGAMLHHFPSKLDIVRAAVDHLHAKRLRAFRKAMSRGLPAHGDHVRQGVEAMWAHVRHPMFVAFFELSVASRTEPELAEILRPAQESFEEAWYHTARELFPEWEGREDAFNVALDLCRYLMEGMAIAYLTHKESERDHRLMAYLEKQFNQLLGK